MMAKTCALKAEVRVAWWLKLYLGGVVLMCGLTGLDFDDDKVGRYMKRGIKVRLYGKRQ